MRILYEYLLHRDGCKRPLILCLNTFHCELILVAVLLGLYQSGKYAGYFGNLLDGTSNQF